VYYAGEMCRRLVDAQPVIGENNNPVRLFAGSGLGADVWRRLVDRFGPVGVLEMYASSEASTVLANARGKKLGSVGRPLPGSPEVAIAAWSFDDDDFMRDGAGRIVHARLDEPGMLLARLAGNASSADRAGRADRAGSADRASSTDRTGSTDRASSADRADRAHGDPLLPRRLVHDAFAPGDLWFVTGDFFRVDTEGDHWFVDRQHQMLATRFGPVASTRIEDALYEASGVALCMAAGRPDPEDPVHQAPVAAVQLHPGAALDLEALSRAVAGLPEYARPHRLRIVDTIAMTDGYRPIKRAMQQLDLGDGPQVYVWDARAQRYLPSVASAARSA
jgi:putative long chain acyl-CoA synthase